MTAKRKGSENDRAVKAASKEKGRKVGRIKNESQKKQKQYVKITESQKRSEGNGDHSLR